MKICLNGKYVELTADEINGIRIRETLMERSRPLTAEEVYNMVVKQAVNTLEVDDNTALRMLEFYPEWSNNIYYTIGFKVKHNGKLYRALQAHTSQDGWQPELVASLWTEICETHMGTLEDPIPYSGNMVLENGKYYHQDYTIYLCIRDSINPVYHSLSELIGLYVEVI